MVGRVHWSTTPTLHTFAFDEGTAGVGSFGNDYLAGSAGHDLIFGQLGNDVIQGDGGIEHAFAGDLARRRLAHARRRRPARSADLVGDLDVVPSFEAATDGEDYIEGGGGNDIVFGGLGQDDIVGGSSDFFSLVTPNNRPDGADLHLRRRRHADRPQRRGDAAIDGTMHDRRRRGHARDADTIVGDNGQIIRIVGINGVDVNPTATSPAAVRHVQLRQLRPARRSSSAASRCSTTRRAAPTSGPTCSATRRHGREFGLLADVRHRRRTTRSTARPATTPSTSAAATTSLFGDAEDDDLIGGWGNDWISGGTGQDGVLGDDGRIFTSRNTAGNIAQFSEPLYGINFLLATDPDTKISQATCSTSSSTRRARCRRRRSTSPAS